MGDGKHLHDEKGRLPGLSTQIPYVPAKCYVAIAIEARFITGGTACIDSCPLLMNDRTIATLEL